MGTEYLVIILLWCGDPGPGFDSHKAQKIVVDDCRREKIECVRHLKAFTTDDVVNKCLLKTGE